MRIWVKPKTSDISFRLPHDPKRRVPVEGLFVEDDDTFWARRITDGDIIITDPPEGVTE